MRSRPPEVLPRKGGCPTLGGGRKLTRGLNLSHPCRTMSGTKHQAASDRTSSDRPRDYVSEPNRPSRERQIAFRSQERRWWGWARRGRLRDGFS